MVVSAGSFFIWPGFVVPRPERSRALMKTLLGAREEVGYLLGGSCSEAIGGEAGCAEGLCGS